MTGQRELFDPTTTVPTACPVGHCQAVRLPGQDRVVTCAHDLDPERRHRPRACLNAIDNTQTPFPDGY